MLGALVCAVFAVIAFAWITRDLALAGGPADVWWLWAGTPSRAPRSVWGSSLADPVLFGVYTVTAVTALRSPHAAGALLCAAAVTVAVRLPSLWIVQADWISMVDQDLRNRAAVGSAVGVGLGALLLVAVPVVVAVTAVRRPVSGTGTGTGRGRGRQAPPAGRPPSRPASAASATAVLFFAVAAGIGAAWQIHWARTWGSEAYEKLLTGGPQTFHALTQPPPAWLGWTLVALSLVAAAAALRRAPLTRPSGMIAAALLTASGAATVSVGGRAELFSRFADLQTVEQLNLATGFYELAGGLIVLWVLARRGAHHDGKDGPALGRRPTGTPRGQMYG
jgi:hypothetical protein